MRLILLVLTLIPIVAFAKDKTIHSGLSDNDRIHVLSTLIQNQDLTFKQTDIEKGCPKNETIGQYISRLIVFGSQGDKHSLEIICDKYSSKNSPFPPPDKSSMKKDCRLSAYTSDRAGESPWHYEFVFRISLDFKTLDRAHLACPGTP